MPPTSSQRVSITGVGIAVCVLIGVSFVAYYIGYKNGAGTKTVSQAQDNTAQSIPTESRLVLGTVEKISGQEITLKDFRKIPIIASSTDQSARMTVVANATTIVERLIQKDIAVIKSEQAAFLRKVQGTQSTTTPVASPEPFTRIPVTLSDIKVGDTIAAFATEDLSRLTTVTATRVEIQVAPSTPAALKTQ